MSGAVRTRCRRTGRTRCLTFHPSAASTMLTASAYPTVCLVPMVYLVVLATRTLLDAVSLTADAAKAKAAFRIILLGSFRSSRADRERW